ncbi:cytochrome P450 [Plantactinospora soyae]|uniref:Cytochrome P450 n=1 Tax=Plantactinospora soyae TaxID=1544732 RepID=A0A927M4P4_9ACTN|nr:cytochrome P450 [Plantactinospora soyae]MBE1486591.1 cytochrome P450 [Plantactinospora soyae]
MTAATFRREPGAPTSLDDMTGLTPLVSTTMCPEPQHVFTKLREEYGPVAPVELEPGINGWLVLGYQEVLTVARQEQAFAADPVNWSVNRDDRLAPDSRIRAMMTPYDNAFFTDGERHRRLRAPIDAGLGRIDQRQLRRAVAALCTDVIADFVGRGEADLVADYAAIIPVLSMADVFGLDAAQGRALYKGLLELYSWEGDAAAAYGRVVGLIAEAVAARRTAPTQDLTSFLTEHPDLHSDAEIYDTMLLLIVGANENAINWISQTLRLMLTDARFGGRLRGGRLGVDDALDEVLWRDPPFTNVAARYALKDMELGGQSIRRGDALILGLAAANADPRIHTGGGTSAEVGNRAHVSWSAGPHSCPARLPARLIVRTAVETALHRLPGVRLAIPAEEVAPVDSAWTRGPAALPVRFTPVQQFGSDQP